MPPVWLVPLSLSSDRLFVVRSDSLDLAGSPSHAAFLLRAIGEPIGFSVALCYNGAYFLPECSDVFFLYLTPQGCFLQLSFQLSHCPQLISEPCLRRRDHYGNNHRPSSPYNPLP